MHHIGVNNLVDILGQHLRSAICGQKREEWLAQPLRTGVSTMLKNRNLGDTDVDNIFRSQRSMSHA